MVWAFFSVFIAMCITAEDLPPFGILVGLLYEKACLTAAASCLSLSECSTQRRRATAHIMDSYRCLGHGPRAVQPRLAGGVSFTSVVSCNPVVTTFIL